MTSCWSQLSNKRSSTKVPPARVEGFIAPLICRKEGGATPQKLGGGSTSSSMFHNTDNLFQLVQHAKCNSSLMRDRLRCACYSSKATLSEFIMVVYVVPSSKPTMRSYTFLAGLILLLYHWRMEYDDQKMGGIQKKMKGISNHCADTLTSPPYSIVQLASH